jgi:SAM-dependent methyltransferase
MIGVTMPKPKPITPVPPEFTLEVDCLTNSAPFSAEARAFYEFFRDVEDRFELCLPRTFITTDLYLKALKLVSNIKFELDHVRSLLREERTLAASLFAGTGLYLEHFIKEFPPDGSGAAERTADHYGQLFPKMDDYNYYLEPYLTLEQRIKKNRLEHYFEDLDHKTALDAGCGGGRYTLALNRLGFGAVFGVDLSPENVVWAQSQALAKSIERVHYFKADVLAIPFAEQYFDFVLSLGVLHHTHDMNRGLREIYRVLKPGGVCYLSVMEKPGGVLMDVVELLRVVLGPVPPPYARRLLRAFGLKEFMVYHILDHLLVPIHHRTKPEELEKMLGQAGFSSWERLSRGGTFDTTERIHQCEKKGKLKDIQWKYGVGRNAYFVTK